jgi:hypothetical protein
MRTILTLASVANRGLIERCKLIVGLTALLALISASGCGGLLDLNNDDSSSQKHKAAGKKDDQKPRTVVVNKGMSKKEEKKLNARLDELEKKVEAQDKKGSDSPTESSQPEQSQQQVEDQVRAAAESYYQAAAARDWGYTYDHLDSETQSAFTEDEWFADNDWLADNGSATYTIQSIEMDSSSQESVANVAVLLTFGDGSTSTRNTYFVYEDGSWKHRFSSEEYNLFATAQAGITSASASSSSSASASASPSAAGTKHIKVVISSDVPVDIFISDDNFDWLQQEEISGTKTYEHDIASDSGLTVSASNSNFQGNVSIKVYENGVLKSQDTDSTGLAQIVY